MIKMRDKISTSALLLCILLLGFFTGCLQSSFSEPQKVTPAPTTVAPSVKIDTKALFEEKCSICHGLDRITSQKKTSEGWDITVRRMQTSGAPISDEEAKIIKDYLSAQYAPEEPKVLISVPA